MNDSGKPSATDATHELAAEARLGHQFRALDERLFRGLTLHSGDIISLLDADGRLLYNSPATERINGFTPEELAEIDTFEMIHPDDREQVEQVFARVLSETGSVHTVQYRYRTKSGDWLWMEAIASNQLDNPAVRGVVANSRDISERVKAEADRARMKQQMLHVQKLESLGVLAGGVAHDFNNLLTVVLGEAELLGMAAEPAKIYASAGRIREAASRASELTQLLLAYAGKGRLVFETTSLDELIFAMRPLLELTVGRQNQLTLISDGDHAWINADARQLRQVILNLVQNAAESSAREVHVRLEVGRCVLDEEQLKGCFFEGERDPGERVYLKVSDNGMGMTPEARLRIFDPFFSTKATGRGLGLAAVHGIVQGHDAEVIVESTLDSGTTFTVLFPPVAELPSVRQVHDGGVHWVAPGRVLVIDDNLQAGHTTARVLRHSGAEVTVASGGAEGLELFDSAEPPFELVVLDMIMPGLSGAETLALLRGRAPDLPVLLYSGFDDDVAFACLKEPNTGFLQKPYTARDLLDALRKLVK